MCQFWPNLGTKFDMRVANTRFFMSLFSFPLSGGARNVYLVIISILTRLHVLNRCQMGLSRGDKIVGYRDVRFGSKVGHIGPKLDNFRTCQDQISVHFGSIVGQIDLKLINLSGTYFSTFWLSEATWSTLKPNLTSLFG